MLPTPSSRRASEPPSVRFLAALAAGLPPSSPGGFPLVVGVSGGADSVGLLVGMCRLVSGPIVVAHAQHDLRDDAHTDRVFVEELAAALGLPCEWRRLAVRDERSESGEGLEARARRLRYDFLARVAHACGGRHVLVAHTADDQAETILHRILRGTGIAGLAGMRRARELCDGVALVRPLLDVPRADVRRYLEEVGTDWREDATNADTARARNFLRHEVLPRCLGGPYPAATAAVVRLGEQAAGVAEALASAADRLLEEHAVRTEGGGIWLRTRRLTGLHPHLVAEVFAALWRREGWPRRDMTTAHYRALADRVGRTTGDQLALPGRMQVTSVDDGLLLRREA